MFSNEISFSQSFIINFTVRLIRVFFLQFQSDARKTELIIIFLRKIKFCLLVYYIAVQVNCLINKITFIDSFSCLNKSAYVLFYTRIREIYTFRIEYLHFQVLLMFRYISVYKRSAIKYSPVQERVNYCNLTTDLQNTLFLYIFNLFSIKL